MEVLGVVVLGILMTACGGGADERAATSGPGGVGARAETDLRLTDGSGPVRQAQSELKREGLYDGKLDGIAGPETKQGIAAFQQREGLQQTARLDRATRDRMNLRALLMDGWSSEAAQSNTATERSGSSTPRN
jgi:peptidoglycan hydrolase-like protein with peptidoglycan-binding domain